MLDYSAAKAWQPADIVHGYTARDTMLYALGLGYGDDPLDEAALRFVYEKNLSVVPTMAAVLGTPGFFWQNPIFGVDWTKIVHGEQDILWHRPLDPAATVIGRNRVASLTDKGEGRGALAHVVREITDRDSGEPIATACQLTFLRGEGGYSAAHGRSDAPPPPLPAIGPEFGAPERTRILKSLPQAALIYRLSGDMNPLHADPAIARVAGFERPILHGLCTYGMAARALLATYPGRLRRLAVRFSAPVFPGESIEFEFWQERTTRLRLRARVPARDAIVLNNGIVELEA